MRFKEEERCLLKGDFYENLFPKGYTRTYHRGLLMIIFGLALLFCSFLGLWLWLTKQEHKFKTYFKKVSVLHQKLQKKQFYLKALFEFFHVKLPPLWIFGLPLMFGSLILIISSWIFGSIAEDIVSKDPLTMIDVYVNQWFFSRTSPFLTNFMVFITDLASFSIMIIFYLLLVLILAWRKFWYDLVFLSLTIPGGMLLTHIMKVAFQRPRPLLHQFFVSSLDYSFPSGHVMNATLLYGIMSIFAIQMIKEWRWQVFIGLFTILLVILVALSRIYLGYHYLSDTLAAGAIGSAWLSLCFIMTTTLKQIRKG
jgi:membrane-associated phospholipid phosphatase